MQAHVDDRAELLSFHAVLGLPLVREPGVVPCIISFSRLSPCFLIICPKYVQYACVHLTCLCLRLLVGCQKGIWPAV